ncbi:MAG TPA: S8 family serine peptidase [Thermoanaerobaculia bacterium]|nr:S8 family serine peptidase [Thermoanaerobaculia bacterium]
MSKRLTVILVSLLTLALAFPLSAARPEKIDGAYYVKFKDGRSSKNKDHLKTSGADVAGEFAEVDTYEIKIKNNNALLALQNNPNVEYVEEVPTRYKMDLASTQATPSLANGLYGLLTTKAATVHARGLIGTGIVVGVADTQLDISHPDIAANLNASTNCVTTNPCSGSGWQNDGETHATHVAGTILGVNNTAGVKGVAYGAKLVHARVLGPSGGSTSDIMRGVTWCKDHGAKIVNLSLGGGLKSRTEENFYNSMRNTYGVIVVAATGNDGVNKVSYPAAYPINIAVGAVDVNDVVASFSNKGTNIDVTAPGVLVLSSVPANTGSEASVTKGAELRAFGMEFAGKTNGITANLVSCGQGQAGEFPAAVAGNIAVIQRGTIDFATKATNAKNAGAVAAVIYNNVAGDFTGTLGAAGTWIPTVSVSQAAGATLVTGGMGTVLNKISSWDHYDGTSMATPHTAGVIALLWAANPTMTANAIETTLKNNCDDKGAAGYDTTYGYGRVNADKALLATGK